MIDRHDPYMPPPISLCLTHTLLTANSIPYHGGPPIATPDTVFTLSSPFPPGKAYTTHTRHVLLRGSTTTTVSLTQSFTLVTPFPPRKAYTTHARHVSLRGGPPTTTTRAQPFS